MRPAALGAVSAAVLLPACRSGTVVLGPVEDEVPVWERDPDAAPVPCGLSGLNGKLDPAGLSEVSERFALTLFHTSTRSPGWAVPELLPLVREAGLSVTLRMVGPGSEYTDSDGDFDLDAWSEALAPWEGSGVEEFIEDGTLSGHLLLDDLASFEGQPPSAEELEELARLSRERLPGLLTIAPEDPEELPVPAGGAYVHLDAALAQYRAHDGDIEEYALDMVAAAEARGVGLVAGMNIASGGDGRSGQPGWREGSWAMSGEEIREYGGVLTGMPELARFLSWEYDTEEVWPDGSVGADWFDEPEQQEALAWVCGRLGS